MTAPARPLRQPAPASAPRPRLVALPRLRTRAPRTPFVLLVLGILGTGLLSLLLLNTALAQGSFRIHDLQSTASTLGDRQQQLQQTVDRMSTPAHLSAAARRLGLVQVHNPGYLRLSDGRVLGDPRPAVAPAPVVPTTTTTEKPSTTATHEHGTTKPTAATTRQHATTKPAKKPVTKQATKPRHRGGR
jgi:hypothetical protein